MAVLAYIWRFWLIYGGFASLRCFIFGLYSEINLLLSSVPVLLKNLQISAKNVASVSFNIFYLKLQC